MKKDEKKIRQVPDKHGWVDALPDDPIYKEPMSIVFNQGNIKQQPKIKPEDKDEHERH